MSELATLQIKVDASGAIRVVDQFGSSVDSAAKKTAQLDDSTALLKKGLAGLAGLAGIGSVALALQKFVAETGAAEAAQAQLAAVLRSTAQAAGVTATELNAQAAALQRVSAFGDDAITVAQTMLLAFERIKGPQLTAATAAVVDLAARMEGDLKGAALAVGKALDDPVQGLATLGRQGIKFTDQQEALVKHLVETNRVAEAQRVILAALETKFGGAAEAARGTLGGAIAALTAAFGNLFELSKEESGPFTRFLDQVAVGLERINTARATMAERRDGWLAGARGDAPAAPSVTNFTTAPVSDTSWTASAPRTTAALRAADAQRIKDADAALAALMERFYADAAAALAFRIEQEQQAADATMQAALDADAAVRAVEEQHYRDAAAALAGRLDAEEDGLRTLTESARVFQEQTQLALADFASAFLKDGVTSLRSFWEQFAELGRDALAQVFAKHVMDKVGDRIAGAFSEKLAGLGMLGTGLVGVFAGLASAIPQMIGASQRAHEAAQAQRLAAEHLAQAVRDQRRDWQDDFLTFSGSESPLERELREIENARDALARQALAPVTARSPNVTWGGLGGDFDAILARLRDDPFINNSLLGLPGGASEAMMDFYRQMEDLAAAFARNTDAAREAEAAQLAAARAQQALTLQSFTDSLALSGASVLSPVQQLAEAQRQYDAILALAKGGDASAIDSLPGTARTLLDAARSVYASGTRYADEFARVNRDIADILAALGPAPGPGTPPASEEPEWWNGEQLYAKQAEAVAVSQAGFTEVVQTLEGELGAVREALAGIAAALANGPSLRPVDAATTTSPVLY